MQSKKLKIKWIILILSIVLMSILFCSKEVIRMGIGIDDIRKGGVMTADMLIPSMPSGYYEESFELTFSMPEEMEVYYTTDGSSPSRESFRYEGGINVSDATENENVWANRAMAEKDVDAEDGIVPDYKLDKATVIRAALFKGEKRIGKDYVFVYFVGTNNKGIYAEHPIISIVCDGEDLFDTDEGIYTNYERKGSEAERFGYVDYFLQDYKWQFSKSMGIRLRGGASREKAQKGFNLFLREEYGNSAMETIFSNENEIITSFSLVTQYDDVKIKDALTYHISDELDIGRKQCFPCNVFLNGEYWGMYYIAERFDYNYFERHYNVAEDNVIMIKDGDVERGEAADISYFHEMVEFVQGNDMSLDENFAIFAEMVDVESLVDYYCLESYVYNQDWPNHNMAMWRTREKDIANEYADNKWRFLLFDTNYQEAMNAHSGKDSPYELLMEDQFIPYLLKNKNFCQMVAIRMCDIANIVAETDKVEELIKNLGGGIKNSVMLSERRFYGKEQYDVTEKLRSDMVDFFYLRPDYVREETRNVLYSDKAIGSLIIVLEDSECGRVKINGLSIDLSTGSWEGKYLEGLTIAIEAIPKDGYRFMEWEILSEDDMETKGALSKIVMPKEGVVLKPVFVENE